MTTPDQVKVTHGLLLMSRFESMKGRELICDFTIEVGNKSFSVHRAVLVASSDFFERMLSSNMKEVREGCVEMKNLGVNAIEQAIEFMYTGSSKITMESVQDILHVAELFQLDGLKNLCFQFLLDNLSPDNCLSVINLAEKYNRQDVKKEAERIAITDFEAVIFSEMFPLISRSDLLHYISNVDYQASWKAAIKWAKDKEEFPQLIEGMDMKKFPFKFLLETVLEEPLVKGSERVKKLVVDALFADVMNLQENMVSGNCIHLKSLANKNDTSGVIDNIITRFLAKNFAEITTKLGFCDFDKADVITIFELLETKYVSENVKWEAAVKWVKYDIHNRKGTFPELFCLINLENLPLNFLQQTVREECLVKDSRKCYDRLVDVAFSKAMELEKEETNPSNPGFQQMEKDNVEGAVAGCAESTTPVPCGTIINQQPTGGEMTSEVLLEWLPGWSGFDPLQITYSFSAGQLKGIDYPSQEFKAYLPTGSDLSHRLTNAFNAGQVFKLEQGQKEGQIVWGDIPHKTDIAGGPDRNGYPDRQYLRRLHEALTLKGF